LRARVIAELHGVARAPLDDDARITVLAMLADLGERDVSADAVSFHDPGEVHRRSLAELAELLGCRPDVALAADLLVTQLDGDALLEFVDDLTRSAPVRARHLIDELLIRTDLDPSVRGELVRVAAPVALIDPAPLVEPPHGRARLAALRHPSGRTVVVVARRDAGRWRLLCVLVDDAGTIAECLYRDDASSGRAIDDELVAPLVEDGFVAVAARAPAVRTLVADAARRTEQLPSAYFLGRDLLDLGDAHRRVRWQPDLATTLLGRGVDLLAAGDVDRARPLLERCAAVAADDADAAATLGLCRLAGGELDGARRELERAASLDPAWPLHHWNLAAIAHRDGRLDGCFLALRRFLHASRALPAEAALAHDPDQPSRIALAERFIADHERMVRLEHPGADAVSLARRAARRDARGSHRARGARVTGAGARTRRRRAEPRNGPP
jgi:Tfp pilus assembly protein PilF